MHVYCEAVKQHLGTARDERNLRALVPLFQTKHVRVVTVAFINYTVKTNTNLPPLLAWNDESGNYSAFSAHISASTERIQMKM